MSSVLILSACASSPKASHKTAGEISDKTSVDTALDITDEFDTVIMLENPPRETLPKRLLTRATSGTIGAAKGVAGLTVDGAQKTASGTVLAAKGAGALTIAGSQIATKGAVIAAKGAVSGVKASGSAIMGAGDVVVYGTRRTARVVGDGLDVVMTAPAVKDAASPVGNKTFTDAALSPLSDFNIRRRERPEILMRLKEDDPYFVVDEVSCEWLEVRVAELDEVLGDDYDVPDEDVSALSIVGKRGKSAAISGVASLHGSYIPGRGIIRTLSGAKARKKKTREIYQKGVARRSYLKGVAMSEGCADR